MIRDKVADLEEGHYDLGSFLPEPKKFHCVQARRGFHFPARESGLLLLTQSVQEIWCSRLLNASSKFPYPQGPKSSSSEFLDYCRMP
jgi:hypothetical protein